MTGTAPQKHVDTTALRDRYKELRDEVRLKLHLLGMDARDGLADIEKQAGHLGRELDHTAHTVLGQLIERLETLLNKRPTTPRA